MNDGENKKDGENKVVFSLAEWLSVQKALEDLYGSRCGSGYLSAIYPNVGESPNMRGKDPRQILEEFQKNAYIRPPANDYDVNRFLEEASQKIELRMSIDEFAGEGIILLVLTRMQENGLYPLTCKRIACGAATSEVACQRALNALEFDDNTPVLSDQEEGGETFYYTI